MQRQIQLFSVGVLLILMTVPGCATRKYVAREIGNIEPQIAQVQDNQAQQAERIDAVDRRAREGLNLAGRAGMAAGIANERATAAGRVAADAQRVADAAQQGSRRALNRLDTMEGQFDERISNIDKYTVAYKTTIGFNFDSDLLSPEMISRLDDIAGQFSGTEKGYVIELHGFTDSTGSEKYNFGLSERRAESVLRYLVSKNVPLYRVPIVGLGTMNPIADNKTTAGRELNRRVEVRVLLSSGTVAAANR
jgi:outer membrane protein OmpA-like peptidoglycan-associated protein